MKILHASVALALATTATSNAFIYLGSTPGGASAIDGAPASVLPNGPNWDYTYYITLTAGNIVGTSVPQSDFVIFDFYGAISAAATPAADWSVTVSDAPTPELGQAVDTAAPDVAAYYTGPAVMSPNALTVVNLGSIVVTSAEGPLVFAPSNANLEGRTVVGEFSNPTSGNIERNTQTVLVPVPETSTVLAGGALGLLIAAGAIRRRLAKA